MSFSSYFHFRAIMELITNEDVGTLFNDEGEEEVDEELMQILKDEFIDDDDPFEL